MKKNELIKYKFGEVEKTLNKKTFYLEEKAKEASGLTVEHEKRISGYALKLQQLENKYKTALSEDEKLNALNEISEIGKTLEEINKNAWYNHFEKCLEVMNVILVEGSEGLTVKNFDTFDAQTAWSDFFTHPLMRGKD